MLNRRSFLQIVGFAANAGAALVLGIPGVKFILNRGRTRGDRSTFVPITSIDNLIPGTPARVTLLGERRDAFVLHPSAPLGSVFLIRESSPTSDTVRCLHTTCPHLGCSIQFSAERRLFACPCHTSAFDLAGKVLSGPSPRSMDELNCRVTNPDATGKRWVEVRYQSFAVGTSRRTPLA